MSERIIIFKGLEITVKDGYTLNEMQREILESIRISPNIEYVNITATV